MDNNTYNQELKLRVSQGVKEALVAQSKHNLRSINAEANYILGKALGILE